MLKSFECENFQYFKSKKIDLQLVVTNRFVTECINTRRYCVNSLSFFASNVWDMDPSEKTYVNSLQKFKTETRKWDPKNYSCYLCRSLPLFIHEKLGTSKISCGDKT